MSVFVPTVDPPIATRLATKAELQMNKRVGWGKADAVTIPEARTTTICLFPGPMDGLWFEDLVTVLTHETLHIAVGGDDPPSFQVLNRGLCRIERDCMFISMWREASNLTDNEYLVALVLNSHARGMPVRRIAARVHASRRWVRQIIKRSRAYE